jgi:hypothetical protein
MFERIGRLAERAATGVSVSRRGFLGRLGQSALGVVGVLAGLAATTAPAKGAGKYVCCTLKCFGVNGRGGQFVTRCWPPGTNCSSLIVYTCYYGGKVVGNKTVSSCSQCK